MVSKNKLSQIQDSILLTGETGVGKSSTARSIHEKSERSHLQFIQVNVASLSEELFESEIFGHKKGSFTGAHNDKIGFCEKVGKGTLFLDEIGDLSLRLQKKLLTLVDEKVFFSVGSTERKKFKGQMIFATHRNLKELVKQGLFREDLYYRICTFSYELRPLRELVNKNEIIDEFIVREKIQQGKKLGMTSCVREWVQNYRFPGNFRELKQLAKYIVFSAEETIEIKDLPLWISQKTKEAVTCDDYYKAHEKFEKKFFVEKLKKYQGMINKTSSKINISKVTLISKIKKYDINIVKLKMELMNGI